MLKIWIKTLCHELDYDYTPEQQLWTAVRLALRTQKTGKVLEELDPSLDGSVQWEEATGDYRELHSTHRYEFPIKLTARLEHTLNACEAVEKWEETV